ncbi:hypothetical protein Prum_044080 [Phytohabitans rumicis]|uniref:Uncharacterized protein n=1 Tax=Phytohabitans rumicis TaxID=1076125 RepID=A0A6V8L9L4_9ACTN|nr:hypothetical protein Prum_044080 [Phytohabitans rumicis]
MGAGVVASGVGVVASSQETGALASGDSFAQPATRATAITATIDAGTRPRRSTRTYWQTKLAGAYPGLAKLLLWRTSTRVRRPGCFRPGRRAPRTASRTAFARAG